MPVQSRQAFALLLGLCLWNAAAGQTNDRSETQDVGPPKPKVYALIAAVGGEFNLVVEVPTTGTHLAPYRRTTTDVPNGALNRLALSGLDTAVLKADPNSRRIYMVLPGPQLAGVEPSLREKAAISKIVSALERLPQRHEWDRIVVATPAYSALEINGMASKLSGMGLFSEPLCQAGCGGFRRDDVRFLDQEPSDGVDAVTSEGKSIKARTYLAPYSYITVWILDPKTLAVLDKQQGFDNQKLAEPVYKAPLNLDQGDTQQYLNRRIAGLISSSIGEAVMRSEVNAKRGTVEVGEIRVVKPEDVKK
jgi:hypothetical protein